MFKNRVSTKTMIITTTATTRGGAVRKFNADAVLANNNNNVSRSFVGFAREQLIQKGVYVAQAEGLLRVGTPVGVKLMLTQGILEMNLIMTILTD
jgi:hypothetical protein